MDATRRLMALMTLVAGALLSPFLAPVTGAQTTAPTIHKTVNANNGTGSTGYGTTATTTPGATVDYRLDFTFSPPANNGNNAAATVTDVLQAGQTPLSYDVGANTNASCAVTAQNQGTYTVTCQVVSANENNTAGTGVIWLHTQVNSGFSGVINNTATISQTGVTPVNSNQVTVSVQGTTPQPQPQPQPNIGQYVVCGVVTTYTTSTVTTGTLVMLGQTYVLSSNVTVTGTITQGVNECLVLTFNNGQVVTIAPQSNLAGFYYVCGVYAPVTGATGSINVGGYNWTVNQGTTWPFTPSSGQYYCFMVSPASYYVTALLSFVPTRVMPVAIPPRGHHGSMVEF